MHSIDDAIAHAEHEEAKELCVIGGAQIYALFLPIATRLEFTYVQADVEGNTMFPYVDLSS